MYEAGQALHKELAHLVRLLEPLEKDGGLDVPGLATLNGARKALEMGHRHFKPQKEVLRMEHSKDLQMA
jgi:hypothetical protein